MQLQCGNKIHTKKVHVEKLTKAHTALGNRRFTGDRRTPIQPPSVNSAESAAPSEGAGKGDKNRGSKNFASEACSALGGPKVSPTAGKHHYNLRSQSVLNASHVCRISSVCLSNCHCLFSSRMALHYRRVVESRSHQSVPSAAVLPSHSTLIPAADRASEAVARLQRQLLGVWNQQSSDVQWPAEVSQRSTVDRPPKEFPWQSESWVNEELPVRIEWELYNNPCTGVELEVERLLPNTSKVNSHLLLNQLILVHRGYIPDAPPQFEWITTRSGLLKGMETFRRITRGGDAIFGMDLEFVSAYHYPQHLFRLRPVRAEPPFALFMQLTAPDFSTLVIDLREVCVQRKDGTARLPEELESLLMDPQHKFILFDGTQDDKALQNLCGVGITFNNPREGCIQGIDLRQWAHQLFSHQWNPARGFSLLRVMQFCVLGDIDLPEGVSLPLWLGEAKAVLGRVPNRLKGTMFLGKLSSLERQYCANDSAWPLFVAYHLLMRFEESQAPAMLHSFRRQLFREFSIPSAAWSAVQLPWLAHSVSFELERLAQQVAATAYKEFQQQHYHPGFCFWLDMFVGTISPAFRSAVSRMQQEVCLDLGDRVNCLRHFLHSISKRWRLQFDSIKLPRALRGSCPVRAAFLQTSSHATKRQAYKRSLQEANHPLPQKRQRN